MQQYFCVSFTRLEERVPLSFDFALQNMEFKIHFELRQENQIRVLRVLNLRHESHKDEINPQLDRNVRRTFSLEKPRDKDFELQEEYKDSRLEGSRFMLSEQELPTQNHAEQKNFITLRKDRNAFIKSVSGILRIAYSAATAMFLHMRTELIKGLPLKRSRAFYHFRKSSNPIKRV